MILPRTLSAFLLILLSACGRLSAQGPRPAYLAPNYTGPGAPAEILPDLKLATNHRFAHPGILHSQSEIDSIRKHISDRKEPWTTALEAMRKNEYCRLDYRPKIIPVINPADNTVGYLMKDATAAYGHALLWCITGERSHANKAIEILDACGSRLEAIEVGRDDGGKLMAGFTGGKLASAAELILHYRQTDGKAAGWSKDSADQFKEMMLRVFYPRIENFKPEFNGNWDASMMATMMAIAVLADDHGKFNRAVDYFLHGKGNGAITRYIHPHGQNQETARDQIHGQMGLGALAAVCEIARQQGMDLYGVADNRLAAGYEYMAKYLSGEKVDVVGEAPISEKGRNEHRPIFELAYQHYVVDKGMHLPYLQDYVLKKRPEGVDLIVFPSWGTLTLYRGPRDGSWK